MHGKGVYTWPAIQQCYTGQWKDGKRHGHGRHYFHSSSPDEVDDGGSDGASSTAAGGDYYDGEWKEGVMNGKARYVDASGEEHEGLWVDGACPEVVRRKNSSKFWRSHKESPFLEWFENLTLGRFQVTLQGRKCSAHHSDECCTTSLCM